MTCHVLRNGDGTFAGFVCTRGRRPRPRACGCGRSAWKLCDGRGEGKRRTCDRPLCDGCAFSVGGDLDYRAALHAARVRGFQWVSGSIVERPSDEEPSDVDLVTFVGSRDRITDPLERKEFVESVAMAFDPEAVHARYGCHGYVVDLGTSPAQLVKQTAYWESLFAHRKTGDWRGYVSLRLVDLDEDAEARSLLGEEP